MGYQIPVGGPGLFALVIVLLLDVIAAAFLVANALHRPASDYAGVPEGRWFYVVPQAFYVLIYVVAQLPFLTKLVPWAGVYALVAPLVLVQQFAYMLRVVFPTHGRLQARLHAAGATSPGFTPPVPEEDPAIARSTTNA